jgi:hypothetical protein
MQRGLLPHREDEHGNETCPILASSAVKCNWVVLAMRQLAKGEQGCQSLGSSE